MTGDCRLTVFLNAVAIGLYLFTGIPYLMMLVALDYGIRVFGNPKYSPLKWIAGRLSSAVGLPTKMTDEAPKKFAARVGFLFAASSVVLMPINPTASIVVAAILQVFALLDSVLDICVGCLTYSYIVLPFYKWRGIR